MDDDDDDDDDANNNNNKNNNDDDNNRTHSNMALTIRSKLDPRYEFHASKRTTERQFKG